MLAALESEELSSDSGMGCCCGREGGGGASKDDFNREDIPSIWCE